MKVYERAKIGRCIAWTGDNFVFEYGDSEVIKFSKLNLFRSFEKAKEHVTADHADAKRIFGKYMLETTVARSLNGRTLALIQPKIIGRPLSSSDLEHESIRLQFTEFMNRYRDAVKAGHAGFDLIGLQGVLTTKMANIFVTPEHKLTFIDVLSLSVHSFYSLFRPFFWIMYSIGYVIQERILYAFQKKSIKYIHHGKNPA